MTSYAIITPVNAEPWIELAAPAAPETEQPQAPPEQPQQPALDAAATAALIAALAALLLRGGADAHLAVAQKLIDAGFAPSVATGVASAVKLGDDAFKVPPTGTARRQTVLTNMGRGAQFIVNAAKRATARVADGTPLTDAIRAEAGYGKATQAAMAARWRAAKTVDQQAASTGAREFRWRAVLDDRTDSRCKALDGTTFTIDDPPAGTFPGGVHPACRCTASPVTSNVKLSKENPVTDTRMRLPSGEIVDLAHPTTRTSTGFASKKETRTAGTDTWVRPPKLDAATHKWMADNYPGLVMRQTEVSDGIRAEQETEGRWVRQPAPGEAGTETYMPAVGMVYPYEDGGRQYTAEEQAVAMIEAEAYARRNIA